MKTRRNWTPAMKARVVGYYNIHGASATQGHFRISGSQLSNWINDPSAKVYRGPKANGQGLLQQAEDKIQAVNEAITILREFLGK